MVPKEASQQSLPATEYQGTNETGGRENAQADQKTLFTFSGKSFTPLLHLEAPFFNKKVTESKSC